jgi:hypothetical protein
LVFPHLDLPLRAVTPFGLAAAKLSKILASGRRLEPDVECVPAPLIDLQHSLGGDVSFFARADALLARLEILDRGW